MDWCVHDMGISWTEAGKKWADAEPFIEIVEEQQSTDDPSLNVEVVEQLCTAVGEPIIEVTGEIVEEPINVNPINEFAIPSVHFYNYIIQLINVISDQERNVVISVEEIQRQLQQYRAEEALEDVDEVADVAESVEHSDAIHLAEQLEQGDLAGSSDTSILRYLRVLFAEEDEANNFLIRYPYLEIGFYDPLLTNMLMGLMRNGNNNSRQQLLDEINQCRCCVRHQTSRPTRIGSTPLVCINTYRTYEEMNVFLEECNCPCRHLARFIVSDVNGRVYFDERDETDPSYDDRYLDVYGADWFDTLSDRLGNDP
jgi:hypothetical protein